MDMGRRKDGQQGKTSNGAAADAVQDIGAGRPQRTRKVAYRAEWHAKVVGDVRHPPVAPKRHIEALGALAWKHHKPHEVRGAWKHHPMRAAGHDAGFICILMIASMFHYNWSTTLLDACSVAESERNAVKIINLRRMRIPIFDVR